MYQNLIKKKDYIFNKHLVLGFGHFFLFGFKSDHCMDLSFNFMIFVLFYYRIHR